MRQKYYIGITDILLPFTYHLSRHTDQPSELALSQLVFMAVIFYLFTYRDVINGFISIRWFTERLTHTKNPSMRFSFEAHRRIFVYRCFFSFRSGEEGALRRRGYGNAGA